MEEKTDERLGWNIGDFIEKYNLGDPIAGNFYQVTAFGIDPEKIAQHISAFISWNAGKAMKIAIGHISKLKHNFEVQ